MLRSRPDFENRKSRRNHPRHIAINIVGIKALLLTVYRHEDDPGDKSHRDRIVHFEETRRPRIIAVSRLLELDLCADLLKGFLDLLGIVLRHAFFKRLRRAFDEILGFFQAEAGNRAHFLNHFDLLVA